MIEKISRLLIVIGILIAVLSFLGGLILFYTGILSGSGVGSIAEFIRLKIAPIVAFGIATIMFGIVLKILSE